MNYKQLHELSYQYLVSKAAQHECFKGKKIETELERYFVLTDEEALQIVFVK